MNLETSLIESMSQICDKPFSFNKFVRDEISQSPMIDDIEAFFTNFTNTVHVTIFAQARELFDPAMDHLNKKTFYFTSSTNDRLSYQGSMVIDYLLQKFHEVISDLQDINIKNNIVLFAIIKTDKNHSFSLDKLFTDVSVCNKQYWSYNFLNTVYDIIEIFFENITATYCEDIIHPEKIQRKSVQKNRHFGKLYSFHEINTTISLLQKHLSFESFLIYCFLYEQESIISIFVTSFSYSYYDTGHPQGLCLPLLINDLIYVLHIYQGIPIFETDCLLFLDIKQISHTNNINLLANYKVAHTISLHFPLALINCVYVVLYTFTLIYFVLINKHIHMKQRGMLCL